MEILWKLIFFKHSLKYGRNVLEQEQNLHYNHVWGFPAKTHLLIHPLAPLSSHSVASSSTLRPFIFTSPIGTGYAHLDHRFNSMPETIEHRILRRQKAKIVDMPEFPFITRPPQTLTGVWTNMPNMLSLPILKVFNIIFKR